MKVEQKICIHCKSKYDYQSSGDGCHEELNDSKYCPDCMEAIIKALKSIPVKFEEIYTDASDEVSYKDIIDRSNFCKHVHVLVKFLLSSCKSSSSNKLCSKVCS